MNQISCESCGKTLQVPESMYGQMVQCPICHKSFRANPPATFQAQPPPPLHRPVAEPVQSDWDEPGRTDRWGEDREEIAQRHRTPHRGSTILTLGILSLVICGPILGPIAWVMGTTDLKEMAAGRMDRSGEGITRAGQVIGMVATILSIIAVCIYGMLIMLAAGGGGFR